MPLDETNDNISIMDYEFISEDDKLVIINEHIASLEREHYNWILNRHRTSKMKLSGDEREERLKMADDNIEKNLDALKVAREQREGIEENVPVVAQNGASA